MSLASLVRMNWQVAGSLNSLAIHDWAALIRLTAAPASEKLNTRPDGPVRCSVKSGDALNSSGVGMLRLP